MNARKMMQTLRLGMLTFTMLGAVAAATACTPALAVADDDAPSTDDNPSVDGPKVGTAKAKLSSKWDESWGQSGEACWPAAEFTRTAVYRGNYDPEEAVQNAACDIAEGRAEDACLASGNLCTAHARVEERTPLGCTPNRTSFNCTCEVVVECTYTLW